MGPKKEVNRTDVIVYGAGDHGLVVADSILGLSHLNLIGFIDDSLPVGTRKLGYAVLGGKDVLMEKSGFNVAIGCGLIEHRLRISKIIDKIDCSLISIVDATACVSRFARIGRGVYVGKRAVINTNAIIQDYSVINTSAIVEHDCQIGSYSEVSVNACVGGAVKIGNRSYIGIGAAVRDHLQIGNGSIIGAGSVVVSDLSDHKLCYGIPAKVVKEI